MTRHSVAFSGFGTAMPECNLTIPFLENSLAKPWRAPSFIQHVIQARRSSSSLLFGHVSRSLSHFEANSLTGAVPFWGRCDLIPGLWTLITTTCLAPFDDSLQWQRCETKKKLTCRQPFGHSAGNVDAGGLFATAASPPVSSA